MIRRAAAYLESAENLQIFRGRYVVETGPNFACLHILGPHFWEGRRGSAPEFLDLYYKAHQDFDYVAKFRGDRPRELGDRRGEKK